LFSVFEQTNDFLKKIDFVCNLHYTLTLYHCPNDSITLSCLDENSITALCRDKRRATQFSQGMATSGNQLKCTGYCELSRCWCALSIQGDLHTPSCYLVHDDLMDEWRKMALGLRLPIKAACKQSHPSPKCNTHGCKSPKVPRNDQQKPQTGGFCCSCWGLLLAQKSDQQISIPTTPMNPKFQARKIVICGDTITNFLEYCGGHGHPDVN
jgi:hypothetical protein